MIIRCEWGVVVEDTVIANAFAHIADAHAELVGKVPRDRLLTLARSSPDPPRFRQGPANVGVRSSSQRCLPGAP